jgi:hypothetical protein
MAKFEGGHESPQNTFESLDVNGLKPDQKQLLRDYMEAHEGQEYYGKRAQFMIDFLRNPGEFEPTDFAKCSAFCDFVLRRFDQKYVWRNQVKLEGIDWERLQNVGVDVVFRYSSTLGKESAVKVLRAEARKDQESEWEKMQSGGVAFLLEDWVQKKPKDHAEAEK